jgi:hypothetical protein
MMCVSAASASPPPDLRPTLPEAFVGLSEFGEARICETNQERQLAGPE